MCFSASASFTTSALLIPTGIYCLRKSVTTERLYLPLSAWPLFFGIQQAVEGFLWLGMVNNQPNLIQIASLSFLFFSHFFWLVWTPFSLLSLETNETNRWRRIILIIFTLVGLVYGALLYLPLLSDESLLNIKIVNGSMYYAVEFIFDDLISLNSRFVIYAMIILVPLFISSNRRVNFLGWEILLAAMITYLWFSYAFSSVWCFFAAIISIYVVYAINQVTFSGEPQN